MSRGQGSTGILLKKSVVPILLVVFDCGRY